MIKFAGYFTGCMKLAIYLKHESLRSEKRLAQMLDALGGCELYDVKSRVDLRPGTDMVLSVGGDGTFLTAATMVAGTGVPVLGVNLGRLGFLSENRPEDVAGALLKGEYTIEDRGMLQSWVDGRDAGIALNEIAVTRCTSAMLGVGVTVDGQRLPTYWADGLLVSTSIGSTAYSLSVGGPICLPDTHVFIIAPIAPHNLNVRPLVVPSTARIELELHSRDGAATFTRDNAHMQVDGSAKIAVSLAQFSLKRVRLAQSNFIGALQQKLFWGEDVRNDVNGR